MTRAREEGAVAVLVALTATLLFVFGAFAVDLGAAYAERRVDQTSADAAALGGANALPDMGGSPLDAMKDAAAYVEANLPKPPGGWDEAWSTCTDPDHLAQVSSTEGECISVSAYDTRVRVVIPPRVVKTALAGVIGISEIRVSAFAEAQIEFTFGADVLPFALANGASGPEICIRAATPPQSFDPCVGPADGNFGTLNFTHFGNSALGTLRQCDGDMGNSGRLSRNIALGIDHPLSVHPGPVTAYGSSAGDRVDEAMCAEGADHGSRPNATRTQAGLRARVLQESLLTGFPASYTLPDGTTVDLGVPYEGRLRQYPRDWPSTWPTATAGLRSQDNRGLWTFMPQPGEPGYAELVSAVPAQCDPAGITNHAQMTACLESHALVPGAPPLFTRDENSDGATDLLASPRFAWVPELWEPTLASGVSGTYHFFDFRPVYLESLTWCPPATGCTSWYAGGTVPVNSDSPSRYPQELSALLLADSVLAEDVLSSGPFSTGTPSVVLNR